MLLYFIGDSFAWFLVASIVYGLAGAFITGTVNALLYDTLIKLKRTSEFKKFNGKIVFYSHFFNALVLLAIPVVYEINVKLPFLIGAVFFYTTGAANISFINLSLGSVLILIVSGTLATSLGSNPIQRASN